MDVWFFSFLMVFADNTLVSVGRRLCFRWSGHPHEHQRLCFYGSLRIYLLERKFVKNNFWCFWRNRLWWFRKNRLWWFGRNYIKLGVTDCVDLGATDCVEPDVRLEFANIKSSFLLWLTIAFCMKFSLRCYTLICYPSFWKDNSTWYSNFGCPGFNYFLGFGVRYNFFFVRIVYISFSFFQCSHDFD